MADIHGNYRGLKQVLERSGFDKENDLLIQTGDIVDGFDEVYECVRELSTIKNLITIRGNHDDWFVQFILDGRHPADWGQGGRATQRSYLRNMMVESIKNTDIPSLHQTFFLNQKPYYIDDKNRLFIHGGFDRHVLIEDEPDIETFWWDRDFFMASLSFKQTQGKFKNKNNFTEVFLGHTPVMNWGKETPINSAGYVWNLDTGSGYKAGKLTIMDIDTKEYWQSDIGKDLYPEQGGR